MMVPELRAYYLEMAHKRGTRRPFDEAVRHYFQGYNLIWERYLDDIRKKQQNGAPSTESEPLASAPHPESARQPEINPVIEQNKPQPAVVPAHSSLQSAPCARPVTGDDRWTFAYPVLSYALDGESSFYSVSTMCILENANTSGLPALLDV
jgi:hypothetical protein